MSDLENNETGMYGSLSEMYAAEYAGYDFVMGFDPGLSGGMALLRCRPSEKPLESDSVEIVRGYMLPVVDDCYGLLPLGKSGKKILDVRHMHNVLHDLCEYLPRGKTHFVIERQQEIYTGGYSRGSFTNGFNYGLLVYCIESYLSSESLLGSLVKAERSDWKVKLGVPKDKKLAMKLATRKFGDRFWPKLGNHGVAEAALLALYRYRVMRNVKGKLV